MATRKITETLNFAEGLLKLTAEADNVIGSPGISPRDILTQCGTGALSDLRPDILEPLGVYQGRAVLVVLATELALRFLWEREQESKTAVAKNSHTFPDLFKGLSKACRDKIRHRYLEIAPIPKKVWKSLSGIFKRKENSSVQWRYIVEEGKSRPYIMQATYLIALTRAVIEVAREIPS